MRISTLLKISVSATIVMVLGLAVANWLISASVAEVELTRQRAQAVERDISTLLVLTHEYALYSEERAALQWQVIQSAILKNLEASTHDRVPAPAEAFKEITVLPELFRQLDAALSNKSDLQNRQRNLLLSKLQGSTQVLADSVHRWNLTISKHLESSQQRFRLLALVIPVLMLSILAFLAFIFNRRVLRPLTQLNRAVSAVAQGDLTVRSATANKDEFGELSRTFDAMAIDLVTEMRQEIAERKRVETALRESEEKYRILFRDSPDAYLIVVDGLFIDCNHATEVMLRSERSQIVGLPPEQLSPEFQPDGRKSSESADEKIRNALQAGNAHFEWVHRRLDGSDFIVDVSVATMILEGKPALFTTWRDISARRKAEKEKEAALASIKKLEGIIPICMYCKKIRDDGDSWNQLERYITAHSEAIFSHGVCPNCYETQMETIKKMQDAPG